MFGHEQFGAYRHAIQFAALAADSIEKLPDGYGKLIDQFRRATISISLNIAEGSGKATRAQRDQCYATARGEAMECAAVLDILECMRIVDSAVVKQGKEGLRNVVAILTTVCQKKTDSRPKT